MNRFAVLSFLLLVLPVSAQEKSAAPLDAAAAKVTADGLKAHLTVLASDEYQGRNTGYPGNDKAAEYIAAHFKKIGLKPGGEAGDGGAATYFQGFKLKGRATRNVLGLAEGTDPELKSEIVVIGAHFDHVGVKGEDNAGQMKSKGGDPEDKIWNGADDNGSGTVTVLEIARAFMEGKVRAKRTVLFMTFSGEEYGLVGSKYYVDHPIHPLAKTVAMINLDMVGRNPTKPMDVGGVGTSTDWGQLCDEAAKGTGLEFTTSRGVMPGSDHFSFASAKIPAVHFFTGFHGDYHCQSDHADKIDYDRMAKIGKFGVRLLGLVADAPRMAYTVPQGRLTLGVDVEPLDEDDVADLKLPAGEGGLRILSVKEGSSGEAAGVKVGDLLVEFNGKKLPFEDPADLMRSELKKVKDGVPVPIAVLRDGKRVELKAVWGKKKSY